MVVTSSKSNVKYFLIMILISHVSGYGYNFPFAQLTGNILNSMKTSVIDRAATERKDEKEINIEVKSLQKLHELMRSGYRVRLLMLTLFTRHRC